MGYQLKPGTVLEKRYQVREVIGHGGFANTYLCVDEHIKTNVAVKELYIMEYMERDSTQTAEVSLLSEKYQDAVEKAKENFLKEAIIIGIFNGDGSVVNVLDHFRTNNTAYIVMEYLKGISLSEWIKANGVFLPEVLFEKMLPLIHTLKKIHASEVIHRDISPDNIVVLEDGSLKLIDFGAARNYSTQEVLSQIVKDGFAPVEQWNRDGKQGPWTDIYALFATIYACITGQTPESSIQRMFYDELKKPSELGIEIPEELERILWKGLAVAAEDRYQNLDAVENEVRKIIAPKLPDSDAAAAKLKGLKTGISGILAVAAAIGGIYYYQHYKETHKFSGIRTETVILAPDEKLSAIEYNRLKQIIKEKVEIFAGDTPWNVTENEDGTMTVQTSLDLYGNIGISEVCDYLLAGDWKNQILIQKKESGGIVYDLLKDDIRSAVVECGDLSQKYIKVELTEQKAEELTELWNGKNIYFLRYFEPDTGNWEGYEAALSENGQELYIYTNFAENDHTGEVFLYNLSQEEEMHSLRTWKEVPAVWEPLEHNMLAGKYQQEADAILAPYVTLCYSYNRYHDPLQRGELIYTVVSMKDRLDALEIPYAFGTVSNQEQFLTVRMSLEDAKDLRFVYESLLKCSYDLDVNNQWNNAPASLQYGDLELVELDGEWQIAVHMSSYELEELQQCSQEMLDRDIHSFYIKMGDCILAVAEFDEPITDTTLYFKPAFEASRERTRSVLNYLVAFHEETEINFFYYELSDIVFSDEEGLLNIEENLDWKVWRTWEEKMRVLEAAKTIDATAQLRGEEDWSENTIQIDMHLSGSMEEMADALLKYSEQIYLESGLEDGLLQSVSLYYYLQTPGEKNSKCIYVKFDRTYNAPEAYIFGISGFCQRMKDDEKEILKTAMESSVFFQQHMKEMDGFFDFY